MEAIEPPPSFLFSKQAIVKDKCVGLGEFAYPNSTGYSRIEIDLYRVR